MRKILVPVLLCTAVVSSIATSTDEPPPPTPDPTTGPWQSSDSALGTFTLAPDEVMVLTYTVDVNAQSVATIEESSFSVYLTPYNQQAGGGADAVLSIGGSADSSFVSTSDVTVEHTDTHLDCVNTFSYCRATYTLEVEQSVGGRLDIDWFAEAIVYGDGGIEGPISISVTE